MIMHRIDVSKGIQVGGYPYRIDLSKEAKRMLLANNNMGECDSLNRKISLMYDADEISISETFLHECIEAINHVYCNHNLDHERICQLSFGLHQVFESLGVRFGK